MKTLAFALLATALASISSAGAQTYPSRPITINVPYAAGGPLDATMRVMAEGLREVLGQSIIIENVGGAGGSIGVGRAVRAAPDGYTISAGNWASHVATGAIYSLPFDLLKDLAPVSLLPDEADLILSRKGFPAKDLRELITWLKANPGKASAGTSGIGGPSYMSALFFEKVTDTHIQLIPYRGAGPAFQDLVAGQVDFMITGPAIALPQVREGNIRAYAVTAKNRLPTAPEIPTTDEAGLPGFYFSVWTALWVPKDTPKEIIARLNAAVRTTLDDQAMRRRLAALELEIPSPDQMTPEALGAFHKAEIEKWWPIIKAANIKGE